MPAGPRPGCPGIPASSLVDRRHISAGPARQWRCGHLGAHGSGAWRLLYNLRPGDVCLSWFFAALLVRVSSAEKLKGTRGWVLRQGCRLPQPGGRKKLGDYGELFGNHPNLAHSFGASHAGLLLAQVFCWLFPRTSRAWSPHDVPPGFLDSSWFCQPRIRHGRTS